MTKVWNKNIAWHVDIFIEYKKAESTQIIILCIALGKCEVFKVNCRPEFKKPLIAFYIDRSIYIRTQEFQHETWNLFLLTVDTFHLNTVWHEITLQLSFCNALDFKFNFVQSLYFVIYFTLTLLLKKFADLLRKRCKKKTTTFKRAYVKQQALLLSLVSSFQSISTNFWERYCKCD